MQNGSAKFWVWLAGTLVLFGYWLGVADPISANIVSTTVLLGLSSALVAVTLGSCLVAGLLQPGIGGRCLLFLTVAAATLPVYLQVGAWDSAFGKLGWLTGMADVGFKLLLERWLAATWIHGAAAAPQVALILTIGFKLGRGTYEEHGLMDASPGRVFWSVTLPRMLPFLLGSVFWVMLVCSREIAVTDIYQIGTLAEQVYLGYALGQTDQLLSIWSGDALGIGITVHILTIAWFALGLLGFVNWLQEVEWDLSPGGNPLVQGTRFHLLGWLGATIVIAIPLANLITRAAMKVASTPTGPARSVNLSQLQESLNRTIIDYRDEIGWSLLIGLCGGALLVILGVLMGHGASRNRFVKFLFIVSIVGTCCLPGPVIGTGLLRLSQISVDPFSIWLFDRTIFGPVLASMIFIWPIIGFLTWQLTKPTNRDQQQHSELEGAGFLRQLWSVTLGGKKSLLFSLFLIAMVMIMGELSASQLVVPPGMDTLPRLTLGLMHSGVDEMTAAINLLTLTLIVTIAAPGILNFARQGQ